MVNKYFQSGVTSGTTNEQRLLEDIIIESIQIYGFDVYYIPRSSVKEDAILGEDVLSQFNNALMVEVFLTNINGWGGEGEIMSKFGLDISHDATFVISRRRWSEAAAQQTDDIQLPTRPAEGDLIYFPKTQSFFEITFTNHLNPFYQLSQFYVYELQCSLFKYSSETMSTGNTEIDQHAKDHSNDLLDYMLKDASGNPILNGAGEPIIGENYEKRLIQPIPNDAADLDEEAKRVVNFDVSNPFNEGP